MICSFFRRLRASFFLNDRQKLTVLLLVSGFLTVSPGMMSAHAQGVSVSDTATPVSLSAATGSTQFLALNVNGSIKGGSSGMSSSFVLDCSAPSALSPSIPFAFDEQNRVVYDAGVSTGNTVQAIAVGVPYNGTNCKTSTPVTLAGSSILRSAVDPRHARALFLSTFGTGGADVLTSYSTNAVGDYTQVGNLVKEAQTALGSGGQYTAMVADEDGQGIVAVTELRTDSSTGGLWVYSPGVGRAYKVLDPNGNNLPAVNAFIIPNPKNNNGSLLVLANQDNLTYSNIQSPPSVTTIFTIIDLGQLLDLIGTSTQATTVQLPFVSTISTEISAYAIFGAGYSTVDRKLYSLLGGGTSRSNTFTEVVQYDPFSPGAPAETPVATLNSVGLQAFSLPQVTLNAAARTLQILTNSGALYTTDISGTTSSAAATALSGATFGDSAFSPVYIATNPLAGETYIASSGSVDVLTLPSTAKPYGSIDLIAPLSEGSIGVASNIRLLSFFPVADAALSSTNITVTATAASTGQSFTFATVDATTGKDLPAYLSGTFPAADTYTLVASFPGDAVYPAFSSAKAVVSVGVSPFPTTIIATATGSGTSGTASVTLSGSTYAPTGTIVIKDAQSGSTLKSYSLPGGAITYPVSIAFTYTSATSAITATYNGDSKNGASTSAPATITSSQATSSLTLTLPASAVTNTAFSGSIRLTTSGAMPLSGSSPTGNIVIYGKQQGSASVTPVGQINAGSSGVYGSTVPVSITIPAAGTWSVYASYDGDTNFSAAKSATQTVTVSDPAPSIVVTPPSLNFVTAVNSTSYQDVTVTNNGNATLNINSIVKTGSAFSITTTCGTTLEAQSTCTIRVTFSPTASGSTSGNVTVSTNAAVANTVVTLTGTTPMAGITLNPASLTFDQAVGSTSAYQNVLLTNSGTVALTITSIGVNNAAFTQINGCPSSLAAGAQCTIRVNFAPTQRIAYTGQVSVVDSASGSPHTVSLTGNGLAPVSLTATSTTFIAQTIGTASIARPVVTLSNNTSSAISITLINLDDTSNFERNSTSCGTTLAANSNCSFPVEFHPTTAGAKTLNVLVTTSASSALKVTFTGTGLAAGACTDTDGDKLCDDWEQNGVWVRGASNGEQFLDLPKLGADVNHKDIFLHIDWMATATGVTGAHSHQPLSSAMATAVASFANAPVANPDGKPGINLHIDCGPTCYKGAGGIYGNLSLATQLTELTALDPTAYDKNTNAFSWATFDQNSSVFSSSGRSLVFHHVIFAHDQHPGYTSSGISRNSPFAFLFSQGASDLIVSLGSWTNSTGTSIQQAGTLMHELGHNLALQHGGQDGIQYKPNYLSIMNYLFQTVGLTTNGSSGLLDYSENTLPDLSEGLLNEQSGLGYSAKTFPAVGPLPAIDRVGTRFYCPGDDPTKVSPKNLLYVNTQVNWDCNTTPVLFSAKVQADINVDGKLDYYSSFQDWPALNYGGGSVGGNGIGSTPVDSSPSDTFSQDDESLTSPLTRVTISTPGMLQTAASSTTTLRFVVTNSGTLPDSYDLTAASDAGWANAAVTPATLTLASGASAEATVTYTVPAGSSDGANDRIVLSAQSQNYAQVNDSGQVFAYASSTPAPFSVSMGSLTFGTQSTGGTSSSRPLVITNTGASALAFPTISTSIEFSQTNTCSGSLPAGGSCVVNVAFAPASVGSRTGTLSIVSSASSTATSVALVGTAVTPQLGRPTVTLVATPNATSTGQTVTLTLSVAGSSGSVKPSGTVTVFSGDTQIGQAMLDGSGNAIITTSSLAAGTYDLLATYSGDNFYLSANAPDQSLTIATAAPSSITLAASAAAIAPGSSVTLTATVPVSSGLNVATGTIKFFDGTNLLGSALLNSSGVATYSATGLGNGTHSLSATYSGDAVYASSASASVTVSVTTLATTVKLASSATTATAGTAVVFTATVTATSATPNGTVSFIEGSATLGIGTLNSSGMATFTTSSLPVGTHSITAQYAANGVFLAGLSNSISVAITGTPDFSVSAAPTSLSITSGGSGTATFTVTPSNGYGGTVKLSCGNLPVYAACSFAPSSLAFTSAAQTAQASTITITTAGNIGMVKPKFFSDPRRSVQLAALLWLPVVLSAGLLFAKRGTLKRKQVGRLFSLLCFTAALCSTSVLTGCASANTAASPKTPAGTYSLSITVSDGATSHAVLFPVTVN